jgi:hypothetical protein
MMNIYYRGKRRKKFNPLQKKRILKEFEGRVLKEQLLQQQELLRS